MCKEENCKKYIIISFKISFFLLLSIKELLPLSCLMPSKTFNESQRRQQTNTVRELCQLLDGLCIYNRYAHVGMYPLLFALI